MPCMKRGHRVKKAPFHSSAAKKKSARGSHDKQIVNRTFCFLSGLYKITFVRASENTLRTMIYGSLEGKRIGLLLGGPNRRRPALSRPARPAPPPTIIRIQKKRFLNFNTPNQKTNVIFIQKQGFVYTIPFYDENSYLIKGLISYDCL